MVQPAILYIKNKADNMRILLIEDAPEEAKLFQIIFYDHEVYWCGYGRSAIATIKTHEQPGYVVTDLNMPQITGWDIVDVVRARWATVPIFVWTNQISEEAKFKAKQYGVLLVQKPNDIDDYGRIRSILETSSV
ncbi:MAG TPA: response regulator [Rhabdochlamydiaceae bacterium]|nr:response regulator [Rhabdochlamydiaceae bacterium]